MARPASLLRHSLPWAMPLVLLLVAGGLLAGAFAFEIWGGLKPCTLCLYQRWPHALVVIFAGLALGARGGAQTLLLVISAISLWTGAAIAGFHVGVEQGWWPGTASCGTTETPGDLKSLMALLEAQPIGSQKRRKPLKSSFAQPALQQQAGHMSLIHSIINEK